MTDSLDTRALVEGLLDRLADSYVFPERAATVEELLRGHLGAYVGPVDEALCEQLNEDLFEASRDKHLRLIWHPAERDEAPSEEALVARLLEQFRLENRGVRSVERLRSRCRDHHRHRELRVNAHLCPSRNGGRRGC